MLAKWINQPALCEATGWPLTRPRRVLNIRATTARKPTSLALRTEEFNPIGIQNRSQTHSRYDPRSATDHVRQGGFISGWAIDPVERGSLPSAATRTLDLGSTISLKHESQAQVPRWVDSFPSSQTCVTKQQFA